MGEQQALPEEMLTKKQVIFGQFMLQHQSRYSDYRTLSDGSTCEIPTLRPFIYLKPEKGTPPGQSLPM